MIRIECECKTCKINAEKIGASFPLKADVPELLWSNVSTKGKHGLVYYAHDPSAAGRAFRSTTHVVAVV